MLRRALAEAGEPQPAWAEAATVHAVTAFADDVGWPVVLKTPRGGYDGKGVFVVDGPDQVADLLEEHGTLLVEERVAMVRELVRPGRPLAVRAGRRLAGGRDRPARRGLRRGVAPAPGLAEELATAAQELAVRIADRLGVVGMLAVELFETADGVLVNELAMRPHNSGHWTIEGARTSQFEQHLRAVLDYPLGDTAHDRAGRGDGQRARRGGGRGRLGRPAAGRAHPPLHGALAGREAALVRQGPAPRPQARPRDRARAPTWPRCAPGRWPRPGTWPTAWWTPRSPSTTEH